MSAPVQLQAELSGPNAQTIEATLREFLSEQFGGEAQRAVRLPPEAATRGPEWMEWVTLALSVPCGVLGKRGVLAL